MKLEINASLRSHQVECSEVLSLLHKYLPLIIERFYDTLPLPALSFEPARLGNLGWYREEDGLALYHRINLNSLYTNRPLSDVLRTLTHEVGHCWQHVHGKPAKPGRDNYHNSQFQRRMQAIGIPCNKLGVSLGMQEPSVGFLKELGVEAEAFPFKPEIEIPPDKSGSRSGSHLKPWACKCPRARVWASIKVELSATCHKCGSPFQRQ